MRKRAVDSGQWTRWMRLLALALLYFLSTVQCPLSTALATPLVADLSNYRIDIDSGFNGTRIFLFGARNDNGDVVVVVRGPARDYIVRKKERIAGIWVNRERMKFFNVPDFYAVASSRSLEDMDSDQLLKRLGIGQGNLVPGYGNHAGEFSEALLRHQLERRLYLPQPEKISFMGETLFKTVIEFPDDIPPGDYTAEIYLLSDNEVTGMQSTPVRVVKSGLDEFLSLYAHQHPALYGFAAVALALFVGWSASRVFEKI